MGKGCKARAGWEMRGWVLERHTRHTGIVQSVEERSLCVCVCMCV